MTSTPTQNSNSRTTLVLVRVFLYILGFIFATFTRQLTAPDQTLTGWLAHHLQGLVLYQCAVGVADINRRQLIAHAVTSITKIYGQTLHPKQVQLCLCRFPAVKSVGSQAHDNGL
jgi:hypothetical protein